ncbi:MAG: extracellular solute-binding protein [Clostridium sp.]|nr:extracellular solute-binding protein [Clostridium sp.]
MMKKIVSILTMLVMVLGVTVACGEKETPKDPAQTPAVDGGPVEEGAIGSEANPVKVTVMLKDASPTDEAIQGMVKVIEEKMAENKEYVSIEFLEPPTGTYGEAVPLAFRTGQITPDIIYFQGGDLPITNDGLLEDLTPYVEKSTYVKDIMEEHTKVKLENYPYLLWLAPARVPAPVMRKDFAEQLDSYKDLMDDPTVENYEKMFNEIVDKNIAKYAITADGDLTRMNTVFNQAFGVTGSIVEEDGKKVFSKASSFEKDKLEFFARLYADGLIDPEYITKAWDTMEKSFYEGEAAFVAATAGAVINIYNNKMTQTHGDAAELVVLPPAKGVSQGYVAIDVTKESRGFGISVQSEVKDAAFAILDFMASPEGMKLDKLGLDGTHYNVESDKIVFTDQFPEWYPRFWETLNKFEPTPALAENVMSEPALESLEMAKKYYVEDVNVLIPDELTSQWDAMNSLYKEYSSDIIRGVRPISAFDEFVQKWNESGGTEFEAYLAEQLN